MPTCQHATTVTHNIDAEKTQSTQRNTLRHRDPQQVTPQHSDTEFNTALPNQTHNVSTPTLMQNNGVWGLESHVISEREKGIHSNQKHNQTDSPNLSNHNHQQSINITTKKGKITGL